MSPLESELLAALRRMLAAGRDAAYRTDRAWWYRVNSNRGTASQRREKAEAAWERAIDELAAAEAQAWAVIDKADPPKESPFLRCPDCKKKGVKHFLRPRGEDGYSCRYCDDFDCFTCSNSPIDYRQLVRLADANTGREVIGANEAREALERQGGSR